MMPPRVTRPVLSRVPRGKVGSDVVRVHVSVRAVREGPGGCWAGRKGYGDVRAAARPTCLIPSSLTGQRCAEMGRDLIRLAVGCERPHRARPLPPGHAPKT